MISTPRCGHPVKAYELSRPSDVLDVVPRTVAGTSPCWRPAGHAGTKHLSEASWKRMLARRSGWYRRQRRMSQERGRVAA